MASYETQKILTVFMETASKFNVLPFKITTNTIWSCKVYITKKWILLSSFSVTIVFSLLIYFTKELVFRSRTYLTSQDYILYIFFTSICLTILGCQVWLIIYLKSISAFLNSLFVLNKYFGKHWIQAVNGA